MYTLAFDPTDVYANLDRNGLHLGQKMSCPRGDFILSKASEDLAKGNLLVNPTLLDIDAVTYSATAKTLVSADAGSAVASGALAGLYCFINDDTSDIGEAVIIEKNSAAVAVAGAYPITITLSEAYTTSPSGADIDLIIIDPNYCELSAVSTLTQRVVGVSPVAVDVSETPYFWRQVSGFCPVMVGGTYNALQPISAGDDTEGQGVEVAADETADDIFKVGTIIVKAPAADTCAMVMLNNLG